MLIKKAKSSLADAALADFTKTSAAIALNVAGLSSLMERQAAAEARLALERGADEMGEKSDVVEAEQALGLVRGEIGKTGSLLSGLRARLAASAPALIEGYEGMSAELPEHVEAVVALFRSEWQQAIEAFGAALGRRRALENLIGTQIELPEPTAAPVDLEPEVVDPFQRLKALRDAVHEASVIETKGKI